MRKVAFCVLKGQNDEILMGKILDNKFQGDIYNFPGGKVEEGETMEQCAVRELKEEVGVEVNIADLEKSAELTFLWPDPNKIWNIHVFTARKWVGEPHETAEMIPKWFKKHEIPFDNMWEADKHWIPLILEEKKIVGTFKYDENKRLIQKDVKNV